MATNDKNNSGLLSKVAKFVRNPTTNWSDLDKQDAEPDSGYTKQALKQMIERKRQNDFVRKREFDQLRKLRNRGPGAGNLDLAGRPSYFQSSFPSNQGERASTIKKIDEIEAQMSNQWWQGKTDAGKPPGAGIPDSAADAAASAPATPFARPAAPTPDAARASDIAYAPTRQAPMLPESNPSNQQDFPATETASFHDGEPDSAPERAPAQAPRTAQAGGADVPQDLEGELSDPMADGDLEEAAIRFANGDSAGAESALLEALKSGAGARRSQVEIWSGALFDLYRATGQQARFDSVALDFAQRFGRSAPAWFSIPDMLGLTLGNNSVVRTMPSGLDDEPLWSAPAHFTRHSLDALQLALASAPMPWFIDWGPLASLEPEALDALAALVAQWASRPVQLRFRDARNLAQVLRAATPAGNRSIGAAAWKLRMDVLRILGQQDDFELVALEYCVTFELSPPAWQDARCSYLREDPVNPDAEARPKTATPPEDPDTKTEARDSQGNTLPMGYDSAPAVVELSGEILGEATQALARLEAARQGAERLVVSCASLIRVDFSAAGSILNWVARRQSEGCHVQFRDVHRLVGAFFHVIGIHEHARVVLRSN